MRLIKRFQQGGPAPMATEEPASAPAPEMGGAPQQGGEDQLAQIAGQVLQSLLEAVQDPNIVMQILQLAMEMLQESMGGGQPVFRSGGKLVKKNTKKACSGGKMK